MTAIHPEPAGELRILHWNIHSWRDEAGGSNLDAVANLVQATEPHVVSLVEADESWGQQSALAEVAERCGYASIFMPTFEFGGDEPAGGFGNALLSRLPVRAVRQRQLVWPPRRYDGSEPSEPRSVVFAEFQTDARRVWIGSTHLPRSQADTRADAMQRLVAIARELGDQWLLCGDFNMPADSWIGAQPSLRAYPRWAASTHPTNEPVEPIDYCVAPDGLSVEAEVMPEHGSDHLPILVRCRLG